MQRGKKIKGIVALLICQLLQTPSNIRESMITNVVQRYYGVYYRLHYLLGTEEA